MPVDFSKSKIYRLTCENLDLIYYGSTTQSLQKRLSAHIAHYNYWCKDNTKISYVSSYELFKCGGVEIELVLECPCNNRRELEEIEQTYIDNDNCINKNNSYTDIYTRKNQKRKYYENTQKEYMKTEEHKNYQKIYQKKYRELKKINK